MAGLPLTGMFASLLGGIGLFLLGMWLMTDGLKKAAGDALQHLLARGTGTPLRGLATGFLITALVQSSSVATVATIGFVNAGLLDLFQAARVIYGSNVGTTVTSWLAAAIGLKFDIGTVALPLVGIGMLLRLTDGADSSRDAWGKALAGIGCFFAGIGVLQDSFGALSNSLQIGAIHAEGRPGQLLFVVFGLLLTAATQSSSAASAITVTAVMTGTISLEAAAAAVIGSNLGTTLTAVFAAIGATANARRSAAIHVLFNAITAVAAFLLLPWLTQGIRLVLPGDPATGTALFHTLFNLLGVALVLPITPWLVRQLQAHFQTTEEILARPQFIDATIAVVPALALASLRQELQRLGGIALMLARGKVAPGEQPACRHAATALAAAIEDFTLRLNRTDLPADIAALTPDVLRAAQHYEALAHAGPPDPLLAASSLADAWRATLDAADTTAAGFDAAAAVDAATRCGQAYEELKTHLLQVAGREMPAAELDRRLNAAARLRDTAWRAAKAARRLAPLIARGVDADAAPPAAAEPPAADMPPAETKTAREEPAPPSHIDD